MSPLGQQESSYLKTPGWPVSATSGRGRSHLRDDLAEYDNHSILNHYTFGFEVERRVRDDGDIAVGKPVLVILKKRNDLFGSLCSSRLTASCVTENIPN